MSARPLFEPGDLSWEVFETWPYLLTGMRALLMQLAHPKVAAGVSDHSDYRRDPFARLYRTMQVMRTIGVGTPREAEQALAGLAAVHRRVRGGGYSADDPDLRRWVFATLIGSVIELDRRYLHRFGLDERRRYYRESLLLAARLGLDEERLPPTLTEFDRFMARAVQSLEVTDQARRIAEGVLHPPIPWLPDPVLEPIRIVTVDLLPRSLREGYGLELTWSRRHAATALKTAAWTLRFVPGPVRRFPILNTVIDLHRRLAA